METFQEHYDSLMEALKKNMPGKVVIQKYLYT